MNEKQIEVLRVEIAKLNLGKNDYLVLKFPDEISLIERIEGIAYYIKAAVPELADRIILLLGGIETYVVRRENPFYREDRD